MAANTITQQGDNVGGGGGSVVLLGTLIGANFNSTADQAIALAATGSFVVEQIIVTNPSTSLTTAQGAFYKNASKSGAMWGLTTTSAYTGLVNPTDWRTAGSFPSASAAAFSGASGSGNGAPVFVGSGTLFLSLTTPQGAPATADVYIYGRVL